MVQSLVSGVRGMLNAWRAKAIQDKEKEKEKERKNDEDKDKDDENENENEPSTLFPDGYRPGGAACESGGILHSTSLHSTSPHPLPYCFWCC